MTHLERQQDKQTDRHPFNGLLYKTTWVSGTRQVKPIWILMNQEMMAVASAGPYANHLHLVPDR